jgi:hypothetical protein
MSNLSRGIVVGAIAAAGYQYRDQLREAIGLALCDLIAPYLPPSTVVSGVHVTTSGNGTALHFDDEGLRFPKGVRIGPHESWQMPLQSRREGEL